jgi:hypothetical protein
VVSCQWSGAALLGSTAYWLKYSKFQRPFFVTPASSVRNGICALARAAAASHAIRSSVCVRGSSK